jgi:hypothetical protein
MSLAKQMRAKVGADANLAFAGHGYRLDLNPLEDRVDETGFILWSGDGGEAVPVATGRAVGDELLFDESGAFPGGADDLRRLIGDLLQGDPVETRPRPDATSAVPTGA